MKNVIIAVLALLVIALIGITLQDRLGSFSASNEREEAATTDEVTALPTTNETEEETDATDEAEEEETREAIERIGASADGEDVNAYHFGDGDTEVLFIGGIHSGFAPGTVAVAEELIIALDSGEVEVPENLTVTVIKNMNPDAKASVNDIAGRLNSNNVDLNRNFDCEWQADGTWRNQSVSGGSEPFSEPEADNIRDYVRDNDIAGAVVYYAASGGVFASSCNNGVSDETKAMTNAYANAAGYDASEEFDFYEVTGDMVNWLAKGDIPAISVLLSDYSNPEWSKNQAGIEAVLEYFAE